jgi:hypothetical protein
MRGEAVLALRGLFSSAQNCFCTPAEVLICDRQTFTGRSFLLKSFEQPDVGPHFVLCMPGSCSSFSLAGGHMPAKDPG